MRAIRIAVAALAVALVLPVAAEAHTVTPNVNCSAATLSYESTAGTTLSYEIVVNGVPTVANSFVVPATQLTGTLSVPYSAPAGPFTVTVNAVFSTGERGSVTQSLMCTAPPAPPAAPAPPVTTPAAGGTAPVAQKPAQSVAGTEAASASANVAAQKACASRSARITVSGRLIRQVTFSVNGRRVRTVSVRASQRRVRVSVPLSRGGAARQTVTVRVTFRNGAAPRTLTARATRCAQGAVSPQFTG